MILMWVTFVSISQGLEFHDKATDAEIGLSVSEIINRLDEKDKHIEALERQIKSLASDMEQFKQEAVVQTMKEIGHRNVRQAVHELPVAFLASASNPIDHIAVDQVIRFENVNTNIRNAYSPQTGTFTAPVSGLYVFATTLMPNQGTTGHYEIRKNNAFITQLFSYGINGGFESASKTIVLLLNKGDQVNIHNVDSDKAIYGGNFSSFTGFLLKETGLV